MANVLLSKNSKANDFFCSCCREGELDAAFMSQLLRFLGFTGLSSLTVTSGFRCPKHNRDEGGKDTSLHLVGRAIDSFAPTVQIKAIILDAAHHAGLNGIGLGSNFIHLDNREIPAKWTYPKKS